MMLQAYKDGMERGLFIQPTVFPHFLPNRRDLAMYKVELCDPKAKSHDKSRTDDSTETSSNPKSNM